MSFCLVSILRLQVAVDWNIPLAVPGDGVTNLIPLRGGVVIDDASHVEAVEAMLKKLRTAGDDGNLTLSDCLTAFTAEEVLDEDTWYYMSLSLPCTLHTC